MKGKEIKLEYHNCNRTPIDRIDETLMKELRELDNADTHGCSSENNHSICRNLQTNRCNVINKRYDQNGNFINRCNSGREVNQEYHSKVCSDKNNNPSMPCLDGVSLAMLYAPYQEFDDLYDFEEGFCHGTIFKSLNFPFYMASCRGVGNSICEYGRNKCTGGR